MATNPVLTQEQARQITRGRTPLVPLEYETAVKSLQACLTLDEAKYWSDKADALAAWSRIYRNDEAGLKAKRLKLHAFRRIGELAAELRPRKGPTGRNGAVPGAVSLLKSHGFSKTAANAARSLAMMSKTKFREVLREPKSPITVLHEQTHRNPNWHMFAKSAMVLRSWMRSHDAVTFAALVKSLGEREITAARKLIVDLDEWLDELDQALPKAKTN
jgi:hypothetical protein